MIHVRKKVYSLINIFICMNFAYTMFSSNDICIHNITSCQFEIQRIKCVGTGIQKKILSLTLLMLTTISNRLMGHQCHSIPIFNGCRMLGFFLGLFLELDRKYRKQIYKVSYISRNISGIIPAWGNMGVARYREMATLPAGYIPHAKCHRWAAVGYWVSLFV